VVARPGAIVVLTNTTGAGGDFTDVVRRKVMEAFFEDAEDSARSQLELHVNARRERIAQTLAALTRNPEPEWVRGLAGTYTNASLGQVQIRADANGGTLDAGEWQSAFAQKQQADGTVKIVLVDPPLAGGEITVAGDAGHPKLAVEYEQQTYVFERARR
jgi:hypothetical protein